MRARGVIVLVGGAVLLTLAHLRPWWILEQVEAFLGTYRHRARRALSRVVIPPRVLLVLVDDQDLEEVPSRWPWNRRVLARGLAALKEARGGPVAIAADLFLESASREDVGQDTAFAAALEDHGQVLLPEVPDPDAPEGRRPPLRLFGQAAASTATPGLRRDARGFPVAVTGGPGSFLGALATLHEPGRFPGGEVPVDEVGEVPVDYLYLGTFPRVPFRDLLSDSPPADLIAGRTVILGTSAVVLHEREETPLASAVPRAEVLACALAGALAHPPYRAVSRDLAGGALGVVAILLTLLLARGRARPWVAAGGALLLWWGGAALGLVFLGTVVPLAPATSLVCGLGLLGLARDRIDEAGATVTDLSDEARADRLIERANARMAAGDPHAAAEAYREAAAIPSPHQPRAKSLLVQALLARGRGTLAGLVVSDLPIERLERDEQYALGVALEEGGQLRAAYEVLERVYLHDAGFADVRRRVDRLRHQLATFTDKDMAKMIVDRGLDARFSGARMIGHGAMGFVFAAADRDREGEEVAIKALSPFHANNGEIRERFLREARRLEALDHPNLVRVHDVFERSLPYYSMELLAGESLRERLAREGRLPLGEAARIAAGIAAALGHAHAEGVVHRDLKPSNVFLLEDGAVKVIDFGVARFEEEAELTGSDAAIGTPHYMAPEQIQAAPVDGRSDIYALGVVLHEMLAGDLPFGGVLERLVAPPRPLPEDVPGPAALRAVLDKAMALAPGDRYRTMEDLASDLELLT